MDILETLRLHRDYLRLGVIADKCGIPRVVLIKIVDGSRKAHDEQIDSLTRFWNDFTRAPLSAESVEKKVVVVKGKATPRVAKKIGDKLINSNGTFGDGWRFTASKAIHTSGKEAEYESDRIGNKKFIRFV